MNASVYAAVAASHASFAGGVIRRRWVRRVAGAAVAGLTIASANPADAETLRDAIEAAWAADPATEASRIDVHSAHKTANALDSWFPGGPVINGQYLDDHFIGSNVGYTTYQGSVSVPLWLPGQGTASVKKAMADEAAAKARIKMQRLLMAVRVLDTTSMASLLEREIDNLSGASRLLSQALSASSEALAAGEIGAADHEAVVGEKETIEAQIADRRQQLETARATLQTLTGSDQTPDLLGLDGHTLAAEGGKLTLAHDPRIIYAEALRRHADSAVTLARHSYMPAPRVGLEVLKQGQYQSPWDTQVGAVINVPLPSRARNTPMVMKAVRAAGAANRDVTLARRKVHVEYRKLRAQLASSLEIVRHADTTQQALDDRAAQLQKAWRVGETPVIEYLRARRAALDARQRAARAQVMWRAAMVRLLLMTGKLP